MADKTDNQTLMHIYNGMYAALVQRRAALVAEIEQINTDIIKVRRSAKAENVIILRIPQRIKTPK